jgi:mRNA-degrading endonuclease RelE of RelBE toxin-antitoxin system
VDKIEKALQKLTDKERKWVKDIIERLSSRKIRGLDIKKLKGREDIFRVRKSDIRIIYRLAPDDKIYILAIERRHENTYHI